MSQFDVFTIGDPEPEPEVAKAICMPSLVQQKRICCSNGAALARESAGPLACAERAAGAGAVGDPPPGTDLCGCSAASVVTSGTNRYPRPRTVWDDVPRLAVVPERPSEHLDPAAQGGGRDESVAPDAVEQLLLRDEPVPVLDEKQRTAYICGSRCWASPARRS